MAENGIIIIGDQTIGYTERNVYVYWDVAADITTERNLLLVPPFYRVLNNRYVSLNYVYSIYATRWTFLHYQPRPTSERHVFLHYALCAKSDRSIYYHPETANRMMFVEGLMTSTPLLMKYPKYYNWNYVPQIINPEFILWSYYPLAENDITIKIMSTQSTVLLNSGTEKDKFIIDNVADKQYKITVNISHIFEAGENLTCYITAYDIKGNYLKPGMW